MKDMGGDCSFTVDLYHGVEMYICVQLGNVPVL